MPHNIPDSYILTEAGDVGMISCILSHLYFDRMVRHQNSGGMIASYERISRWAKEFHDQYKDFDWETLLHPEDLPDDFPYKGVDCWDEMVMVYGADKMSEFPDREIPAEAPKIRRLKKTKYFLAITFDAGMITTIRHMGWKAVMRNYSNYKKFFLMRTFASTKEQNSYLKSVMDAYRFSGLVASYKKLKVLPDSR